MLVKHNLSTVTSVKLIRGYWHSSGYYEQKIDGDVFKFRNIMNDQTTTAYGFDFNRDEGGDFLYIEIENLGNNPIKISIDNSIPAWHNAIVQPNKKIIVCEKLSSMATLRIGPTINPRSWHVLKFNCFSLTNGATDVYLPNINTLPTNKQPLLPPEGNYKEIQAL